MKKIFLLLIIMFSIIVNVSAADTCESNELKRLKELARNVSFQTDYEFKGNDNKNIDFSITAYNLNKELKTLAVWDYYAGDYKEFKYSDSKEAKLNGFKEGEKVKIVIYAYTPNACSGKEVLTKLVKIPYYNIYYDENFCTENPDFEYCVPLLENKISENTYNNAMNKYLHRNDINGQNDNEVKTNTNLFKIIIGASMVLVVVVVVFIVIIKNKRKNDI